MIHAAKAGTDVRPLRNRLRELLGDLVESVRDGAAAALERAGAKAGNKGWDAALSAMEMADLLRRAR